MKIINIETGTVMTEREFRRSYPNVSFPSKLLRKHLQKYQADFITEQKRPEYDSGIEFLEPGKIVQVDAGYEITWEVKAKPQEEIDAYLEQKQRQEADAEKEKAKAQDIEKAKSDLLTFKAEAEGKSLTMAYLDKRLTALEKILGV